ncbi:MULTISPECIES: hypothetical protein [Pseudomonas]|uniref:Uncharacterized protein n=1 Tax=Pseudomonas fluorescens TaxID=294 RepID=A0A161XG27_PSEFL|nr:MULTISPECIES: hypothetical protein [Pseudomonas]KZN20778.1 hypothetical protein A1D17_04345 [Pseudomonas fluorescens]
MATANNMTIEVVQDSDAESPRKWDNLGVMVCAHRRYTLGDEDGLSQVVAFIKEHVSETSLENIGFDEGDLPSIEKALLLSGKAVVIPLHLYDHSGITMSTSPFHCQWDSGQVGFIYVSKEAVLKEFGWKQMSPKRTLQVAQTLNSEVVVYDQYLQGDVWGFRVNADGEDSDSCWGFYGSDPVTNGILEHLSDEAKKMVKAGQYARVYQ